MTLRAGEIDRTNLCLVAALAYARSGLAVFPAPRGYKMSYKAARFNGGARFGATKDLLEIERDWQRWPNANLGIACGFASNIFVLETDTAAHGVDGEASLRDLELRCGTLPLTRQAMSPSGSRHFYFLMPNDGRTVRNSTSKIGQGIDIRGEGGMVIAPPSQRDDGHYRWINNAAIANAPDWLLSLVSSEIISVRRHGHGHGDPVDELLVAETVKHVPTCLDWHSRNTIGMAIFASTNGSDAGLAIWDDWLRRSGKYNAQTTRQRWAAIGRCPPNNIGYGTLNFLAHKAKPEWSSELDNKLMRELNKDRPG